MKKLLACVLLVAMFFCACAQNTNESVEGRLEPTATASATPSSTQTIAPTEAPTETPKASPTATPAPTTPGPRPTAVATTLAPGSIVYYFIEYPWSGVLFTIIDVTDTMGRVEFYPVLDGASCFAKYIVTGDDNNVFYIAFPYPSSWINKGIAAYYRNDPDAGVATLLDARTWYTDGQWHT